MMQIRRVMETFTTALGSLEVRAGTIVVHQGRMLSRDLWKPYEPNMEEPPKALFGQSMVEVEGCIELTDEEIITRTVVVVLN